jgi:hypothetical protein
VVLGTWRSSRRVLLSAWSSAGEKDSGDRHGHLAAARTRKPDPTSRHGGWQRRLTFTWYSVFLELVFVDN